MGVPVEFAEESPLSLTVTGYAAEDDAVAGARLARPATTLMLFSAGGEFCGKYASATLLSTGVVSPRLSFRASIG